jgi:predicted dehydrogenase
MSIKAGIVGLQSVYWPNAFANCLKTISGVELLACADLGYGPDLVKISLGRTPEEYAAQHGVKLYHGPVEMIKTEDLQAVCICAKHTEIVNWVELAAPTGVNIYMAKPMATSLEAADRIVTAVRANGVIATSGTTERFDGGIREAYQRFKSGAIGDLISIRALHQHGNISGFPEGDWYWDEAQGGPELSLMWYAGDAVRWFAGSEVVNGVMGSIDIYFSVRGWRFPSYEVELVGTEGAIRTQQSVYEGTVFTKDGTANFYRTQNNNLLDEMRHWVQCCVDNNDPELTIEDARSVIELCLACRRSARTHSPITLHTK